MRRVPAKSATDGAVKRRASRDRPAPFSAHVATPFRRAFDAPWTAGTPWWLPNALTHMAQLADFAPQVAKQCMA